MDTDAPEQEQPEHEGPEHETERGSSADPPEGRRRWPRSVRVAVVVASVLTSVLLVSTFVMQPFLIPSSSMDPTLRVGDRVMVNKLAYRFGGHPERGDVVVFDGRGSFVDEDPPGNPVTGLLRKAGAAVGLLEPSDTDYVKRVIGVGGDRVSCCDKRGRIEVNGAPVEEAYLYPGDEASSVPFDIEVPQGRLWVMGDHRSDSSDSRDHLGSPGGGTVPEDRVIGRVEWIGWPPSRWTSLGADRPTGAVRAGGHG